MFPKLIHRLAIGSIGLTLVTLTFGALVTSMKAGMAFPDWPTSDGYLMVTYPWLKDFAVDWDKFLEHGHRLVAMTLGIWSIGLVIMTWKFETRTWVKWLSLAVLLCVIIQGLLGGMRVQLDERVLAMIHGIFAAVVLSLMGTLVVVTGRGWRDAPNNPINQRLGLLKVLSVIMVSLLGLQYVLGSLIRHFGTALHEHLGLGILSLVLILANALIAGFSGIRWLRRSSAMLLTVLSLQVLLGLAAWVSKYGYTPIGYVAVAESVSEVCIRTAHMVCGTLVFMTAVVHVCKVFRLAAFSSSSLTTPISLRSNPSSLASPGGSS